MDEETIAGNTFKQCSGLARDSLAGQIANRHDNFRSVHCQSLKCILRQSLYATRGNQLAMLGLPNPITQVAHTVLLFDFIEPGTSQEFSPVF